jgi:plasmid stabilization system protein ParE
VPRLPVVLSPDARTDLAEIRSYYLEAAGPAVSQRVMLRIRMTLLHIRDFPEAGVLKEEFGDNIRLFVAAPYAIYVQVSPDRAEVLRILHVSRDRNAIMRKSAKGPRA